MKNLLVESILLSIILSVPLFNLTDIFTVAKTSFYNLIFCYFIQTLMNVRVMTWTTVMRMHSALTQRGVSPAPVILATLEMVSTAQVSSIAAFPRMKRTSWNNGCTYYYSYNNCLNSYMRACSFLMCMLLSYIYLFNLQMSMNVSWRHIHVVPMPTVLTLMAATTALVGKVLKEMGSTVQVYTINSFTVTDM